MIKWSHIKWLNSRKARWGLAVFGLLVLAGLIALWASSKNSALETKKDQNAETLALQRKQLEDLNKDSDGDGLKDWEEQIYHTDPHNPDTDGDGTLDGEEIKQGRDPLKPGPNDYIATSTPLQNNNPKDFSPDNLTGRLIQSFTQNFAIPHLSNPSLPIDTETVGNQIVEDALTATPSYLPQAFTANDILVSQDNSMGAFKRYAITFNKIITDSFQGLGDPEILIFSSALRTEDLSKLSALEKYLSGYKTAIPKLKNLTVPTDLSSLHLRYLNTLLRHRETVRIMRIAETDPVRATISAQEYLNSYQELTNTASEISRMISSKHVSISHE